MKRTLGVLVAMALLCLALTGLFAEVDAQGADSSSLPTVQAKPPTGPIVNGSCGYRCVGR
jgi:hypothetical protein